MKEKIVVKSNKRKTFFMFLGCVLFVLLGTMLVTGIIGPENIFARLFPIIIGVISILYFGYMGIKYILSMFYDDYIILATVEGLYENSSLFNWGKIDWEDIDRFEVRAMNNVQYIEVIINDSEKYLGRLSPMDRKLAQFNKVFDYGIVIRTNMTKVSPEALCVELNNFKNRVLEREQNKV